MFTRIVSGFRNRIFRPRAIRSPFVVRPAETDVLSKRQIRHPVAVTLVDNAFGVVLRVVVDDDDLVDDVFGFVEDRIDRLHE